MTEFSTDPLSATTSMATQSTSSKPILDSSTARLLLRSSWGASLPAIVPDSALDDEIAKILLKEAKEKEARWQTSSEGVSAFLDRNESGSKARPLPTNKRFLKSVIRDVNDHNRSLLAQRDPEDCSEDQRRRDPARLQQWDDRPFPSRTGPSTEGSRHRTDERNSNSSGRVRGVDLERLILQGGRGSKGKGRARDTEDEVDVDEQEEMRRLRATRRGGKCDERERELRRECVKYRNDQTGNSIQSTFAHRSTCKHGESFQSNANPGDSGTSSAPHPSSKMDKYFSPTYDPRLDISLDDLTDKTTGLVREGIYDDWDQILGVIKEQKEQKRRVKEREADERRERKERRRLRREERARKRRERDKEGRQGSEDRSSKSKRSRKSRKNSEDELELKSHRSSRKRTKQISSYSSSSESSDGDAYHTATHAQRTARKELGLMDIEGYAKRGKIREWDLGKENPT
ncbi:hypothetical protein CROQUDRAFT_657607 [Cronartium quercuum f. sp. fusiforme G11]|uniref:Uncharacterized protein n=1 Tax=Cronartium quercuum f. sp. fusiforme G11 TaxID=708437 RepID=A0A9P6NLC7_9BASI|nr:hypothetical protein CROQUDRAFT_657607 [Cronartium quercuum f. sp. fusiforme G11]